MEPSDTDLRSTIEARPFEGGAVVPDWADCGYVDAAALRTLIALKRRLEAGGGSLRVGRETPAIRAWLEMAGAGALIEAPGEHDGPVNTRRC